MRWTPPVLLHRSPARGNRVRDGPGPTGVTGPARTATAPRDEPSGHPGEHPAVVATAAALAALAAAGTVVELPPGLDDPAARAAHLGVPPEALAVTGVLVARCSRAGLPAGAIGTGGVDVRPDEPVLVVRAGVHRTLPGVLAGVLGLARLDPADDALAHRLTGAAPGSAAPVGLPAALTTFVDVALAVHPVVQVPAGHPRAVFRTRYDELLRLTAGHPVELG
ncbi:aminoacyl-tRNA deacylase [Kineococcus haloalkalitolerans]|uniref:aminoacyl-tRNA deacylase n=1 Tax=Kineococcus sp. SYSU DK004 TaxID=3383125 RepID=UPI003D7F0695